MNVIQELIKEYEELFKKEVPVSILLHNDETIILLLEKEIKNAKTYMLSIVENIEESFKQQ